MKSDLKSLSKYIEIPAESIDPIVDDLNKCAYETKVYVRALEYRLEEAISWITSSFPYADGDSEMLTAEHLLRQMEKRLENEFGINRGEETKGR